MTTSVKIVSIHLMLQTVNHKYLRQLIFLPSTVFMCFCVFVCVCLYVGACVCVCVCVCVCGNSKGHKMLILATVGSRSRSLSAFNSFYMFMVYIHKICYILL